jgi:cytidylate kinase
MDKWHKPSRPSSIRIERVQANRNLTSGAATKLVIKEDRGREQYLKSHFHARLDNELLYDMAINTDQVSNEDAVTLICEGA